MWISGGLIHVAAMSVLFVKRLEPGRAGPLVHIRDLERIVGVAAILLYTVGCRAADASIVPGGDVTRGKQAIAATGCGACHTIDGVRDAHGEVGPPLTGVARRSIIAGELANTPENMIRWIRDPKAIEPNTVMPNLGVNEQSARDIAAYLYTLH
jgi:cytochrome c